MGNEHGNSINKIKIKLNDLNIFEMFKSDDNEEEGNNEGKTLIEKLEKINSNLKLTSEKISKVEETNYKLLRETQNLKNAQDMHSRNISLNKKSLEEIIPKISELEKKINSDLNKENIISSPNKPQSEEIKTDLAEKNNRHKIRRNSVVNGNTDLINPLLMEKALEINKDLEKKIKEVNKRVNELDKLCKKFTQLDEHYQLKNEVNTIKKDLNKYATNVDLKALFNKSEENEKEIKFIKLQYEDLENNIDLKNDLKSLKKKVELFHNRIETLETLTKNLKKNLDNEINDLNNLSEKIKNLLDIKNFENFKNQLTKEFSNININFIHTRKLLDEIVEAMKEKISFQDIKILEKSFDTKLEIIQLNSYKKFGEKSEIAKSFKYVEQQMKSIFEIIQKRVGENDGWLIAKKPLNLNLCASCESYLGDLKDNNPYVPWNKYPLRDSNDKLYRLGNGYSKMLQMLNIEENEKKNNISGGLGMNLKEDLGNLIKKKDNTEVGGELNNDLNFNNLNLNKTMKNFMKTPRNNFPLIKRKFLMKNKSELNNLVENQTDEFKNRRNKNSDLNYVKKTENSGTNTEKNYENEEEQIIISTSPKITKIMKKK